MADSADWRHPDHPWWVKTARAHEHVQALQERVTGFLHRNPYEVRYEPTGQPHEQRVRLVQHEPIPVSVSAVVGDVVHNLRSALDAVAYHFAVTDFTGTWTSRQEKATAFIVRETPEKFDREFTQGQMSGLYSQRARDAMRTAQPFYWLEKYPSDGDRYADEYRYNTLRLIHEASIVDKHRRLMVTELGNTFTYWGSDGKVPSSRYLTRRRPEDGPDVLAYQHDPPGEAVDHPTVWEFDLCLNESGIPGGDRGIVEPMSGWHQAVVIAISTMFDRWAKTPATRAKENRET